MAPRHWLIKSEPRVYSFDDLLNAPSRTTPWDGVRNYQVRNLMRDEMTPGDGMLFYHSSTHKPSVVGVAVVASAAYPDPTQFDPASPSFDLKASQDTPRWFAVDVRAVRRLDRPVTLEAMRGEPLLSGMALLRRGNRLSVMPVTPVEFETVLALAGEA